MISVVGGLGFVAHATKARNPDEKCHAAEDDRQIASRTARAWVLLSRAVLTGAS
jgi:hypothetical protein